jgi:hypothetical protein
MKKLLELIGLCIAKCFEILSAFAIFMVIPVVNLLVGALIGACGGILFEWIFGNPFAFTACQFSFWQFAAIIGFVTGFFKMYVRITNGKKLPQQK